MKKKILITGGAGFIGCNFVKKICLDHKNAKEYDFVILDALTYAGHLFSIESELKTNSNLRFVQIDIRNTKKISDLFSNENFDGVIHFAAESHVDRSISGPDIFVETNVLGTINLLKSSLQYGQKKKDFRYLQVSTDEVYGSLKMDEAPFKESNIIKPNSPYSSSKASADLFVRSYFKTYGLQTLITRCSNNYGPFQHPEKLIPVMIDCALKNKPLPVYGEGKNVRDWIFVDDHNRGVWDVFTRGKIGEVYNLGGESEQVNLDVVKTILKILGKDESLIQFVPDRLGHDFRYAMDISKIRNDLGWSPQVTFKNGLEITVDWYLKNQKWSEQAVNKN